MDKLQQLTFDLDIEKLRSKLLAKLKRDRQRAQSLLETAAPLIAPKGIYKASFIDEKGKDQVTINGISFQSRVLRRNLDPVGRVFPYVVTIGSELEGIAGSKGEMAEKLYNEMIGNYALVQSLDMLKEKLCASFGFDKISYMSPGSIKDWPIEEQRPLFSLLDGVEESIGVKLKESFLMIPKKSVSGIFFPTEVNFYSCQLCPRKRCEGRRATFSEELVKEYGLESETH